MSNAVNTLTFIRPSLRLGDGLHAPRSRALGLRRWNAHVRTIPQDWRRVSEGDGRFGLDLTHLNNCARLVSAEDAHLHETLLQSKDKIRNRSNSGGIGPSG